MATTILFLDDPPPTPLRAVASPEQGRPQPVSSSSVVSDAALIAVLDAPLAPGETTMTGFARKERELGFLFARLSVIESRALHARLSNPRGADELATRFSRLVIERRARLLCFLADARRRAAIAGGR